MISRARNNHSIMDIRGWEARYKARERPSEDFAAPPTPLLVELLECAAPGTALDLACGTGRNSLWLAEHGWRVTAVDGAPTSVDVLRGHASELGLELDARVADLENSEYSIESSTWDLIVISYYLQRSLFEPAKRGVVPGGIVLAIVHITEPGEAPTEHWLRPGELASYFQGWEILHHHEGTPNDRAHRRSVAEIVARRPNPAGSDR
jgi:tellurite methyltransferase